MNTFDQSASFASQAQQFRVIAGNRPEDCPAGMEIITRKASAGSDKTPAKSAKFVTVPSLAQSDIAAWIESNPAKVAEIASNFLLDSRREFVRSKIDSHEFFNRDSLTISNAANWFIVRSASSAMPEQFPAWGAELAAKALIARLIANGRAVQADNANWISKMLEAGSKQFLWVKVLTAKKLPSFSTVQEIESVLQALQAIATESDECYIWLKGKLTAAKSAMESSAATFDFGDDMDFGE